MGERKEEGGKGGGGERDGGRGTGKGREERIEGPLMDPRNALERIRDFWR